MRRNIIQQNSKSNSSRQSNSSRGSRSPTKRMYVKKQSPKKYTTKSSLKKYNSNSLKKYNSIVKKPNTTSVSNVFSNAFIKKLLIIPNNNNVNVNMNVNVNVNVKYNKYIFNPQFTKQFFTRHIFENFATDLCREKLITGNAFGYDWQGGIPVRFSVTSTTTDVNRSNDELKMYKDVGNIIENSNNNSIPFSNIYYFDLFLPRRELNFKEKKDWFNVYAKYVGYFQINDEMLKSIQQFVKQDFVQEVDAGNGLLTHLQSFNNINMLEPTDSSVPDLYPVPKLTIFGYRYYINIKKKSALDTIKEMPISAVLLISWIYPLNPDAIKMLTDFKGNKLIIIGSKTETASPKFYELLYNLFNVTSIVYDPLELGQELLLCLRKN